MSISNGPHYELSSTELAKWVERQGAGKWWAIDGDPYLNSRVPTPCRWDELASVLRRVNRTLLVADPQMRAEATGQPVTANDVDSLTQRLDPAVHEALKVPRPAWADDRSLWVCWKGAANEWTLTEDSAATEAFQDVETQPLTNR